MARVRLPLLCNAHQSAALNYCGKPEYIEDKPASNAGRIKEGEKWTLGLESYGEFLNLGFDGSNELNWNSFTLQTCADELLVAACEVKLFEAAGVLLHLKQEPLLLVQGKFSIHGLHHAAI